MCVSVTEIVMHVGSFMHSLDKENLAARSFLFVPAYRAITVSGISGHFPFMAFSMSRSNWRYNLLRSSTGISSTDPRRALCSNGRVASTPAADGPSSPSPLPPKPETRKPFPGAGHGRGGYEKGEWGDGARVEGDLEGAGGGKEAAPPPPPPHSPFARPK